MAGALDGVSVVRVPERLDRKAFRARWATSPAEVAAFLTLQPDTDLDPCWRRSSATRSRDRPCRPHAWPDTPARR